MSASRVVLIPGLAGDAVMWQDQLAALAPQYDVQVTDVLRRHGSVEAMAAGLLDDHPGGLVLCGTSMGGMVAMEAARQAGPGRIRGLALLGTDARPESDEMRALREGAIRIFFREGGVEEIIRANVALVFHPRHATDRALTRRYLDFVLAAGADQLIRQNRAVMARPDARPHLPRLTCPVLLMCGDADGMTPVERAREIAALVPQAELVVVPQCGHMLTMEQPAFVNAALLRWLRSIETAR